MSVVRFHQILRRPLITERASALGDKHNVIVFEVLPDATKNEIRHAVQQLFSVQVTDVRTLRVRGKKKVFRQRAGKCRDWKKAYITLAPGQTVDYEQSAT